MMRHWRRAVSGPDFLVESHGSNPMRYISIASRRSTPTAPERLSPRGLGSAATAKWVLIPTNGRLHRPGDARADTTSGIAVVRVWAGLALLRRGRSAVNRAVNRHGVARAEDRHRRRRRDDDRLAVDNKCPVGQPAPRHRMQAPAVRASHDPLGVKLPVHLPG